MILEMDDATHIDAVRWLARGRRGLSSNAMFGHLTGVRAHDCDWDDDAYPRDPDDLWRCRLLLRECPFLVPELPRMASLSPVWARLVARWDDLCRMMDDEALYWPEHGSSAPRTYALMQQLIYPERQQPSGHVA